MGQFNVVFEQITNEFGATFDTVIFSGDATLGEKTITQNGVYNASADDLDGYSKVTANVPNTYTASDEGKVVDNGALVSQTSATYTSNDTYDTTKINSVTVNVSGGGGGDNTLVVTLYKDNNDEWYPTLTFAEILAAYTAGKTIVVDADGNSGAARADGEMHVDGGSTWFEYWVSRYVPNSSPMEIIEQGYSMYSGGGGIDEEQTYIVPTGTKSITANGTGIDVTEYQKVNVAVPNSYSAADEGKVVSNGALVAQTSDTVTANDTYDTTLINSLKVNVSGGGGISVDDIAQNLEPSGAVTLSPTVTTIKANAFMDKPVTSITATGVTSIERNAFRGTSIAHITDNNFPSLYLTGTGTGNRLTAFSYMTSLLDCKLTNAKVRFDDGTSVMRGCTNVVSIEFPSALPNATATGAFRDNEKLELIDLGCATSIASSCFSGASKLRTIILRQTSAICSLNAWSSAVLGGVYSNPTLSTIYVPEALISTYQTATNWSTGYNSGLTFAKIEGSIYEI